MARSITFVLFFTASIAANAQFRELGPAPLSEAAARQQIRTLLAKVNPENRQQTVATISALLPWYRDLTDEELIKAWQGDGRTNLPEVMESLADSRLASAIVEFSWRRGRPDAFKLAYAPLFEHLMARYSESAKPFLDDLRLLPDLPAPDAEVVCRILLDMRDVGKWKDSALQILARYRGVTSNLLAQDLQSADREKSTTAQRWLNDLRTPDPRPSGLIARTMPVAPAANNLSAGNPRNPPNPSRPSLRLTPGDTLAPLDPVAVDDKSASVTGIPALLDFVNQTAGPVDIYWINFNGDRVLYLTGLKTGATWRVRTFTKHFWLVVASGTGGTTAQDTGTCLAAFQPVTPNEAMDPAKRDTAIIRTPVASGAAATAPSVLTRIEPAYTEIARKLNLASALVKLSLVVQPDGTVGQINVVKFMGYGLDEKAIEAARQWRFQPATKEGVAVAARTTIEFNFRIAQKPGADVWNSGPMVFQLDPDSTPPEVTEGSLPKPARGDPPGDVVLEFTVDATGSVKNVRVPQSSETQPELARSLAEWKFRPAMKNNEPVEATGTVTFVHRQGNTATQ
jgi:TonB family protein